MRTWTNEMIESEIRKVAADIGHFPANSELTERRRGDLANAISKNGGYLFWANLLGMERAHSDSDFGWRGEVSVCGLFRHRNHVAERQDGVKAPFDILVNEILRVDVKNARFTEYGACKGWFYRIGKIPQADLIVLHQDDTGNFYGLPWFLCPTSNVTISAAGGKYAQFLNNWPLIERMITSRLSEREEMNPLKMTG